MSNNRVILKKDTEIKREIYLKSLSLCFHSLLFIKIKKKKFPYCQQQITLLIIAFKKKKCKSSHKLLKY